MIMCIFIRLVGESDKSNNPKLIGSGDIELAPDVVISARPIGGIPIWNSETRPELVDLYSGFSVNIYTGGYMNTKVPPQEPRSADVYVLGTITERNRNP